MPKSITITAILFFVSISFQAIFVQYVDGAKIVKQVSRSKVTTWLAALKFSVRFGQFSDEIVKEMVQLPDHVDTTLESKNEFVRGAKIAIMNEILKGLRMDVNENGFDPTTSKFYSLLLEALSIWKVSDQCIDDILKLRNDHQTRTTDAFKRDLQDILLKEITENERQLLETENVESFLENYKLKPEKKYVDVATQTD